MSSKPKKNDTKDTKGKESKPSKGKQEVKVEDKSKKKQLPTDDNAAVKSATDEPKKPKWTGKSPVTQLHEWCQRNDRKKPEFIPIAPPPKAKGFRFKVKTECKKVEETFQSDHTFPTAQEARHGAAVVALSHYCGQQALHLVLPPEFRDLWFDLKDKAKQEAEIRKKQEHQQKEEAASLEASQKKEQNLPQIYLNEDLRIQIESLIKTLRQQNSNANGLIKNKDEYWSPENNLYPVHQKILRELHKLGFRDLDEEMKQEMLDSCDDLKSALDWLCLHLPENQLPDQFSPAKGNIEVKVYKSSEKDQEVDKKVDDHLVVKLHKLGFPQQDCIDVVLSQGIRDEEKAIACIFNKSFPTSNEKSDQEFELEEEFVALQSIFGDEFTQVNDRTVHIKLPKGTLTESDNDSKIVFHVPLESIYPDEPPVMYIDTNAYLPSDILYKVIRELVNQSEAFLGSPMMYSIVAWLQSSAITFIKELKDSSKQSPSTQSTPTQLSPTVTTLTLKKTQRKREERPTAHKSMRPSASMNEQLYQQFQTKKTTESYQKIKKIRDSLPVSKYTSQVSSYVHNHQVVVITGEPGSGKSTQIPQIVLDGMIESKRGSECNIICTQPRRISAIGVAERVATERVEEVGQTVGYQVRLESKRSRDTRLMYCTTGILLRRLQGDMILHDVSHLIIDEVHERSVEIDFLLVIVKDLLRRRRDLKVILMSATLDAPTFSMYFDDAPIMHIPGRTFPVRSYHLDDVVDFIQWTPPQPKPNAPIPSREEILRSLEEDIPFEIVSSLVLHLIESKQLDGGSLLIFVPGMPEIMNLLDRLKKACGSQVLLLPLHSSLPIAQQHRVFEPAKYGQTKVIVSTNIAETSITIDDVLAVIDCGKVNQMTYDARKQTPALVESWVSKASATQRMGRAGRVRPGKCYRIYSKKRFDSLSPQDIPEIQRVPLQQLCLQIKLLQLGKIQEFLGQAIQPPDPTAVSVAIDTLIDFNAIEKETEQLTPLGYHIARLPVDIHTAKLMLFGSIFRCIDPVLTIAAIQSYRSPLLFPIDQRDDAHAAHASFSWGKSDSLSLLNAYRTWWQYKRKGSQIEREFCHSKFLSIPTLNMIADLKRQYAEQLSDIGFLRSGLSIREMEKCKSGDGVLEMTGEEANVNSNNVRMIRAVLCASLYPQVAKIELPETKYKQFISGVMAIPNAAKEHKFILQNRERVFIHPKSFLFPETEYESPWVLYSERMQTTKMYITGNTMIHHYPLLLFCGQLNVRHDVQRISVDRWIEFSAPGRIAVLIKEIRIELDKLLQKKVVDPTIDISSHSLVTLITQLITTNGF